MPILVVIGIFAVLTNHAKDPLSNTDTYFHLRFGHEFLTGNWSLTTRAASRPTAPTTGCRRSGSRRS